MENRSLASRALGVGIGAVALWACPFASAAEIRIDGGGCASVVHLVARDAPLSDVLERLAQALDFQLIVQSAGDTLVSVDVIRQPIKLVASLAPSENISMTLAHNPRCPPHERIVKVWVLPSGQGGITRASITPAAVEQAQRAQAGIDMVLKAHGVSTTTGQQTQPKY